MEYRELGKTGYRVSIIGLGGIVASRMSQEDANSVVARAIDRGVNYVDCAPSYGNCEERLGPALAGKRDKVVLACKTGERNGEKAMEELHRSLKRLQTDYFDIYQLHCVPNMEELNTSLAPGGVVEALIDAKAKGLIKHIGITLHSQEVALEAYRRFDFDTVLCPINFTYWYKGNAGQQMLEEAAKKGMGRIAIKSMARGAWPDGVERKWNKCWYQPIDDPELAKLAVRFTLSQDVNVVLPSGHAELFEMVLEVADNFQPIQPDEEKYLRNLASGLTPIF